MDALTSERYGPFLPVRERYTDPEPVPPARITPARVAQVRADLCGTVRTPIRADRAERNRVDLCGTADLTVVAHEPEHPVARVRRRERALAAAIRRYQQP